MNYSWLGLDISSLLVLCNQYWRYHLWGIEHLMAAVVVLLLFPNMLNTGANHILFCYHSTQDLLDRALLEVFQIHLVVVRTE